MTYSDTKRLKELMIADLKRSGLDSKDASRMQVASLDEDQAATVLNTSFATYGYTIPYLDPKGVDTGSLRFRFTGDLFNKQDKQVRYSQPKGSQPRLYFPPCVKWPRILKDVTRPIVFTEGEKKSYKACKEDIPTIGLGGVWSFMSKKQGKKLIDDFNLIKLEGRKVILCFDNDSKVNPEVMKALNKFAKNLNEVGAEVVVKHLPFDVYKKIGLDDYLIGHAKKDFDDIKEEELDSLQHLSSVNGKVAYIQTVGKFYVPEHDLFVGASQLCDTVLANDVITNDKGNPESIAKTWIAWPQRREHKRLVYAPGEPLVTTLNEYNLWPGWGCSPVEGSIKPFSVVINKIFDNNKELINWFLDWVAYPIQNPGAKMFSAVMFYSVEEGTGKSSIGETIGAMYGENFGIVESQHLTSTHNEWAIGRQFIMGDEILGGDKRTAQDMLKNLITRSRVLIDKKYAPTYSLLDCINYIFNSNHIDMVYVNEKDRRAFIWAVPHGCGITLKQGIALEDFRKGKGICHLLHYFVYEHVISKGFDHRARPPMTDAKMEMIDHSLTEVERYLTAVRNDPDQFLCIDSVPIDRDVFTVAEVVSLYNRQSCGKDVTQTAMGKALAKVFYDSSNHSIRTVKGTVRVRALRNFKKWANKDAKLMAAHYDKSKIALLNAKAKRNKHRA